MTPNIVAIYFSIAVTLLPFLLCAFVLQAVSATLSASLRPLVKLSINGSSATRPAVLDKDNLVIRTNRVTSADIKVEECAVSVVVSHQLPAERIEQLLKDKSRWIKEKLILQRDALPVSSKDYISGEAFTYLGRNYRLKVQQGAFQPVKLKQGRLVVTVPDKQPHIIRNALIRWYKHHAQIRLQDGRDRAPAPI